MSVSVKIPAQLRELTKGESVVSLEGVTDIGQVFETLGAAYPQLLERLVDASGDIRRFVNVYVGDEDVRFLQGLETALEDGATVSILPAVAGGCLEKSGPGV